MDTTQDILEITRGFTADDGSRWEAVAADAVVAHGRAGAALAFRPAGGPADELIRSTITFNSMAAAEFALSTISEKDLRRRLTLARQAAGGL
jgi:hypothetical protein